MNFLQLDNVNVRSVVLGCMFLGGTAGAVGCFALLRKRALLGDALAHAALPGVVIGFLIAGKSMFSLFTGAIITAWAGALAVSQISSRSKVREDSALAIVLSVFFAAGVVGLTLIQKSGNAAQSGLASFLFGHAASLTASDVQSLVILAAVSMATLFLFYKEFKLLSFDATFAAASGLRTGWLDFAMTTLLVVCIVIGLQTVGVVLMAAMLITPAAAARFWSDHLGRMLAISAFFGSISGIAGAYASYSAPNMPTGPWMVVAATLIFVFSLFLAPLHGLLPRALELRSFKRRWQDEHVLKALYALGESAGNFAHACSEADLVSIRPHDAAAIPAAIKRLERKRVIISASAHKFSLTESGRMEAAAVVRRHRLWELFLTKQLGLPGDHVHRDAESMEHLITPELEAELEAELGHPETDPHGEPIPQKNV